MELFKQLHELLETGESFALALIVNRSGSAPRAVGTRMAVLPDATIVGTIGGGILEAQVRDLALEVFSARKSALRKFSFSPEGDTRERMICGGEIEVLVHFVDALLPSNQVLSANR